MSQLKKRIVDSAFGKEIKVVCVSVTTHSSHTYRTKWSLNHLNAELYLICHWLALLGAQPILHVSGIRVKRTVH